MNFRGDNRHLTSYISTCELEVKLKEKLGNPDQRNWTRILETQGTEAMEKVFEEQMNVKSGVKYCTCDCDKPFTE